MLQGSDLPTESNILRYWITAALSRMFASFRASAGTMDMRLHCVGFCIYLRRFVQNECNVLQNLTSNRYLYTYQLYHKHVDSSKNLLSIRWLILHYSALSIHLHRCGSYLHESAVIYVLAVSEYTHWNRSLIKKTENWAKWFYDSGFFMISTG